MSLESFLVSLNKFCNKKNNFVKYFLRFVQEFSLKKLNNAIEISSLKQIYLNKVAQNIWMAYNKNKKLQYLYFMLIT